MNGIELAKEIAYEVNGKVKRVYWTNEQIDKWFGRRSAKEIIDNKTTCFMNPCLDLTLVSSYLMSSQHIPHQFIIEEHLPAKDFNFDKSNLVLKDFDFRLHFAIEFQHNDEKFGINYKRENEVHIFEGEYNGRKDILQAGIIKIPGEKINPFMPLYRNLGYDSLEDLIKDKFKGFSLEKTINRLKNDNNIENFKDYQRRNGEDFKIITTPQNQP